MAKTILNENEPMMNSVSNDPREAWPSYSWNGTGSSDSVDLTTTANVPPENSEAPGMAAGIMERLRGISDKAKEYGHKVNDLAKEYGPQIDSYNAGLARGRQEGIESEQSVFYKWLTSTPGAKEFCDKWGITNTVANVGVGVVGTLLVSLGAYGLAKLWKNYKAKHEAEESNNIRQMPPAPSVPDEAAAMQ